MYSLKIDKIKNRSEINSNKIPVKVPNPSNGTPNLNHLIVCCNKINIDKVEVINVINTDIFKGFVENANIALIANPSTGKVFA